MSSEKRAELDEFIFRDVFALRTLHKLPQNFVSRRLNFSNFVSDLFYFCSINEMIMILRPYLNGQTKHFCNELYSFVRFPYDLRSYDRNVKYVKRVQLQSDEDDS